MRGDASTNAAEGYFSILKRGIYGIYQHVSEEHLHRYLAEFDFRHNNRIALGIDDVERADRALRGGSRQAAHLPNDSSRKPRRTAVLNLNDQAGTGHDARPRFRYPGRCQPTQERSG